MKKLFDSLKEHKKNIIDFERKKIFPSTKRTKITSRFKSMLHYVTV